MNSAMNEIKKEKKKTLWKEPAVEILRQKIGKVRWKIEWWK